MSKYFYKQVWSCVYEIWDAVYDNNHTGSWKDKKETWRCCTGTNVSQRSMKSVNILTVGMETWKTGMARFCRILACRRIKCMRASSWWNGTQVAVASVSVCVCVTCSLYLTEMKKGLIVLGYDCEEKRWLGNHSSARLSLLVRASHAWPALDPNFRVDGLVNFLATKTLN